MLLENKQDTSQTIACIAIYLFFFPNNATKQAVTVGMVLLSKRLSIKKKTLKLSKGT